MRKIVLIVAALLPFFVSAQQVARSVTASNGKLVGFYEYRPPGYSTATGKLPVIIFLHGVGERGNGTTDLPLITKVAMPKYLKLGRTMKFYFDGKWQSFIVLSPQCSTAYSSWPSFYVDEMIKWAVNKMKGDPNRIILTGLSMGGGGTWAYPCVSATNAQKLAAIVPVCGTCQMTNAKNIAANKVAVWAFHSKNDPRVSYSCSNNAVTNITNATPLIKPLLTTYTVATHSIWDMAYDTTYTQQNPNVFEWMLGQNRALAVNKLPVANAGANKSISTGTAKVVLSGAGTDADGKIERYIWKKISGPAAGAFSSTKVSAPTVSGLTIAGTYTYELTVIDNRGSWAKDQVTVTVSAGSALPNAAPVANAGTDATVTLPTSSVALSGTGTDSDGSVASYTWSKLSGPTSGTITTPTAASTSATGLVAGTYTFRLTVKDNGGATDVDDKVVTVKTATTTNVAPVAKAGTNIIVKLPTTTATLNGSGTDADGSISSYKWQKLSGPTSFAFSSTAVAKPTISKLVQGTYVLRLTVTDNKGATAHDDVAVDVTGTSGTPVADAGLNVVLTLPKNSTSVDGVGSHDPNGSIVAYDWTKVSGPSSFKIVSPHNRITTISGLVQGKYIFRLTVTDNSGLTASDDIGVTVNAAAVASPSNSSVELLDASPNNLVTDKLAISPNPAHGYLNVQLSASTSGNAVFSIYDVQGRLVDKISIVKSQATVLQNLDISKLAPGLYTLEATIDGKTRMVTKFIKQ
jgi:poly(3-hydroxybutyrate) depolymerase